MDSCLRRKSRSPCGALHRRLAKINKPGKSLTLRALYTFRRSPTRCPAPPSNNDSWRSRPPTAASGPSSRSLESTRSQHGLENTIWHRQETPRTKTRRRHAKTCAEIPCGPCSVAVCGSILTQRLLAGSPVPGLRQGRLSPVFIDCGQRGEHFSTDGRAVFASAFLSCDLRRFRSSRTGSHGRESCMGA